MKHIRFGWLELSCQQTLEKIKTFSHIEMATIIASNTLSSLELLPCLVHMYNKKMV